MTNSWMNPFNIKLLCLLLLNHDENQKLLKCTSSNVYISWKFWPDDKKTSMQNVPKGNFA